MGLEIREALPADVDRVAEVRNLASDALTTRFGEGHWSGHCSPQGVRRGLTGAKTLVAEDDGDLVGTLRLVTKRPWAIDPWYFTDVDRALYLVDMAVRPEKQRQGIGRALLAAAVDRARTWPAQALRLDAYDTEAGAGGFYSTCGFREVGRVVYRGVPLRYFELVLTPTDALDVRRTPRSGVRRG